MHAMQELLNLIDTLPQGSQYVVVFTDGSGQQVVMPDTEGSKEWSCSAAWYYGPNDTRNGGVRLAGQTWSAYAGELIAILHAVHATDLDTVLIIGTDCLSAAQSTISCGSNACAHSMYKACACLVREINYAVHKRGMSGGMTHFIKVKSHVGYTPNVIVDAMADYYAQMDSGCPCYTVQQVLDGDLYPMTSTPHMLHMHSQPVLSSVTSAIRHHVGDLVHRKMMHATQGAWLPKFTESVYLATRVCDRRLFPAPVCRFIENCRMDRVKTPVHRHTSHSMPCPHKRCRERARRNKPLDLEHVFFVCAQTRPCRKMFVEAVQALWSEHWIPKDILFVRDMLDSSRNRASGRSSSDRLKAIRILSGCADCRDGTEERTTGEVDVCASLCQWYMGIMHRMWKRTAKKIAAEIQREKEREQERQSMRDLADSFPEPPSTTVQPTMREALRRIVRERQ